MKRIEKIVIIVIIMLIVNGCGKLTAEDVVNNFLAEYKNLSSNVISDINEVVANSNLEESQKEVYRDVLKRQYQDLKYEIKNATYEGNKAEVEVKIAVYDYYGVQKDANEYLVNNDLDFRENGEFSNKLFMDYKLDLMQKTKEIVEYTVSFGVLKDKDGNYYVDEVANDVLEKIHGIYNYDNDN